MFIELKAQMRSCLAQALAVESAPAVELRAVPAGTAGDLSLTAHPWARAVRARPDTLAPKIADALKGLPGIARADVADVYVNLHLDRTALHPVCAAP